MSDVPRISAGRRSHAGTPRFCLFTLVCGCLCLSAAATNTPANYAAAPEYPRVNLAVRYEVDPSWPSRPPGVAWKDVCALAVDTRDNIWVHTRAKPAVQVYAPDGRYLSGWDPGRPKSIAHGLKLDRDGCVWLADVGLHTVTKYTSDGRVLLVLGTEGEPGGDARHFNKPTDVAFARNGDVFVADGYGNSRIVQFDRRGGFIRAWGTLGTAPGQFSIPHAIECDSKGRLYVADRNNVRIQIFNTRGRLLDVWDNIMVPWGIWISPKDDIWVCGSSPMTWTTDPKYPAAPLGCPPKDQMVIRFNAAGRVRELWTLPKAEDGRERPGELNWLHSIALDSKGNVFLGDIIGRRAQKFIPVR